MQDEHLTAEELIGRHVICAYPYERSEWQIVSYYDGRFTIRHLGCEYGNDSHTRILSRDQFTLLT